MVMIDSHRKNIQNALNAECCLADGEPRYEIQTRIGDGGVGIVYACHDKQMNRMVALKTSKHPDTEKTIHKVFERESRISSLIGHPNMVTIYDSLVCGNYAILIREFFPETFSDFIDDLMVNKENPTLEKVLQFLEPAAEAIQAAHDTQEEKEAEKGIFHRDIKGANILINRSVKKVISKVSDWGSAGLPSSMSSAMSTLCYRAPETYSGKHTRSSDIYSFALVAVSALKGIQTQYLFDGSIEQKKDKNHLDKVVAPLKSAMSKQAWQAIRNSIDADPSKRCNSIDDFIRALKGQGAVEINTKPAPPKSKAPPKQPSLDSGFMERYQSYEQYVISARQDSVAGTYSKNTINTVLSKLDGLQKYSAKHSLEKNPEYRSLLEKANAFALRMSEEDIEGRIRVFCDIVNIDRGPLTKKERTELKNKGLSCSADIAQALDDSLKAWQPFRGPTDPNHKIYNP